ncbi:hypothetical protein OSB04_025751 [Centaurea solstitialis]|uniref:Thioredoxin domain-containing protein n=1 Tax=Centaurea solstitialis TaxID=347529 RepID=A0AA38SNN7_9ASTR|nr:hypothetical protein OSB04_025751 [Centaurea solstitialis]
MATFTNLIIKPLHTKLPTTNFSSHTNPKKLLSFLPSTTTTTTTKPQTLRRPPPLSAASTATGAVEKDADDRVKHVHTVEEFDSALKDAKQKLVVVEFAARHSKQSSKMYPFMVDLSRTCNDVVFLLVLGDESDDTLELFRREKIEKVPHFSFYKGMEKIHEEEGIGPDMLMGDVLYYGDNHSGVVSSSFSGEIFRVLVPVVQLHNREDVEKLIADHKADGKLLVLDVGLKHCGPCVKVYPTVVKLSKQMETVVFARMNGDENDSCMQFLKDMEVVEVPTFLFIRDGEICGRYVGSGRGELIGEILRYQGVRVTY